MKGSIHIIVQNERVKYEFNLRRNLTIIRGDSATGKTTLIDMIREYKSLGEDSGVELLCEKECVVIDGNGWERQLSDVAQSIVFVDEGESICIVRGVCALYSGYRQLLCVGDSGEPFHVTL